MGIKDIFGFQPQSKASVPLFTMSVGAGNFNPVEDDIAQNVDLNEFLVERPLATFFVRINGDGMAKAGICDSDLLIIDTAIEPVDAKIVLAKLNGHLTIRIFRNFNGSIYLETAEEHFLPLKIEDYMEFDIIGVATKVIHSFDVN